MKRTTLFFSGFSYFIPPPFYYTHYNHLLCPTKGKINSPETIRVKKIKGLSRVLVENYMIYLSESRLAINALCAAILFLCLALHLGRGIRI